jgi:hypothetical protein
MGSARQQCFSWCFRGEGKSYNWRPRLSGLYPLEPNGARLLYASLYIHKCMSWSACIFVLQDGMLKSRDTYEIMTPESVGLSRNPDDAGEGALCLLMKWIMMF